MMTPTIYTCTCACVKGWTEKRPWHLLSLLLATVILNLFACSCKKDRDPLVRDCFFTQYETLQGISAEASWREIDGEKYCRASVSLDKVARYASIYDDPDALKEIAASRGDNSYPGEEVKESRPVGTQMAFKNEFSSIALESSAGEDLSGSVHITGITFSRYIALRYRESSLDGMSPFFHDSYPWALEGESYLWNAIDYPLPDLASEDLLFLPYEMDLPTFHLYIKESDVPPGTSFITVSITDKEGNTFSTAIDIP